MAKLAKKQSEGVRFC